MSNLRNSLRQGWGIIEC